MGDSACRSDHPAGACRGLCPVSGRAERIARGAAVAVGRAVVSIAM